MGFPFTYVPVNNNVGGIFEFHLELRGVEICNNNHLHRCHAGVEVLPVDILVS